MDLASEEAVWQRQNLQVSSIQFQFTNSGAAAAVKQRPTSGTSEERKCLSNGAAAAATAAESK